MAQNYRDSHKLSFTAEGCVSQATMLGLDRFQWQGPLDPLTGLLKMRDEKRRTPPQRQRATVSGETVSSIPEHRWRFGGLRKTDTVSREDLECLYGLQFSTAKSVQRLPRRPRGKPNIRGTVTTRVAAFMCQDRTVGLLAEVHHKRFVYR